MRLFTAFENKSSILFVKLLVLFFHTMYWKCLSSEWATSQALRGCFVYLIPNSMDSENPSGAALNQKVEIMKIAHLVPSAVMCSYFYSGYCSSQETFFPVGHNLLKKGLHGQLEA